MSASCGNCGVDTDREPLCERCNDEDVANTSGLAFMIEQLEAELKPLRDREPLVQEVIEKHKALTEAVLHGVSDCESEDAALFNALQKLAETMSYKVERLSRRIAESKVNP